MVYKIRAVSDEADDFRRDILIDSEATFMELKDILCKSCGYDPVQMSSFFICDEKWEKEKEITLEDMGADMMKEIYIMEDTHLSDMIEDTGQRMLFTFDYLGDRSLFLQVKDEEFGKDLPDAECVYSKGEAPLQVLPLEELDALTTAKTSLSDDYDIDEDFEGSSDYNEDEIADYNEPDY